MITTVPLFLAWAFATDSRWGWLAVGAPILAGAYGWRQAGGDRVRLRERLLPVLVWAWLAALVTSSAVLSFA